MMATARLTGIGILAVGLAMAQPAPGRGGRGAVPGAISGRGASGPLARAASTSSVNAFIAAGGRLPSQAVSISWTRMVSAARRSRSRLECFVMRTSRWSSPWLGFLGLAGGPSAGASWRWVPVAGSRSSADSLSVAAASGKALARQGDRPAGRGARSTSAAAAAAGRSSWRGAAGR